MTRRILALGGAALIVAGLATGAATAGPGRQKLTVFSVATMAQYLNNADDRGRGIHANPFDATTSRLKPKVTDAGDGPFPGDVEVFTLALYSNAGLDKTAGSAAYTCYYNYAKHALCVAYYQLTGGKGTLVASGPIDFDRNGFKMVVTGGTKAYLGARGQVTAVLAARNAQRLNFQLLA